LPVLGVTIAVHIAACATDFVDAFLPSPYSIVSSPQLAFRLTVATLLFPVADSKWCGVRALHTLTGCILTQ